jgi:ATP-dependent DNA helicase
MMTDSELDQNIVESKCDDQVLSESIFAAQREAEAETDEADTAQLKNASSESDTLLPAPKLLQLPQSQLQEKSHSLKARGQQLDLLLLKAESYSHFILENQKRSKIVAEKVPAELISGEADLSGKRKTEAKTPAKESKSKKAKGKTSSTKKSAEAEMEAYETAAAAPATDGFTQPSNLVGGTLMPYQLEGLQWLLSLWENGLSGILADEMGLGKTIQIISLIAYLRQQNTPGPFIIAGPLATVTNWLNEMKKWLPSCPVILYHGSRPERDEIRKKFMPVANEKSMDFPVVITSFEILMIDRPHLERYLWQYIILDEGHRIKNRNCRLVRELKSFRSVSRLLLTGTPIQVRFNFLTPVSTLT